MTLSGGRWSEKDTMYLQNNWGNISLSKMCKKLNRTEDAIISKARKLKLGSVRIGGDLITLSELLKAIGQWNSYSWIKPKYIKNGLPIVEVRKKERSVIKVKLDDFWKWAEKNKNVVNFARFEKGALGKEPGWADEKRKADLLNPTNLNFNREWTNSDDILLISKVKSCRYTYKQLADEFKRTEAAIKRRLYDLNVPYRPIPLDNHIAWTEEENEKMIELYKKGYDTFSISRCLNKTHLSISDRLRARGY